jgi:hypothetical protein
MSSDLINIERELTRLCSALDQLTEEFQGLCRTAADARTDYDQEWAKALLRADEGTQKVKEAEATRACERYMREARIAEAIRDGAKERIRALQSIISVHQSRLRWLDETKRTF